MPFLYSTPSKNVAENYTTSGSANTEIDAAFWKPGSSRPLCITAIQVQGKGGGLTALSGLSFRMKKWTTTASSGGTAVTPGTADDRAPAAVATSGMGASGGTNAVTSGTGGPTLIGMASCGASGPGGWVAPNPDGALILDGNATKSIDLFSASPTASLNYEFNATLQE